MVRFGPAPLSQKALALGFSIVLSGCEAAGESGGDGSSAQRDGSRKGFADAEAIDGLHCPSTESAVAALEQQVIRLVNLVRAEGAMCGGQRVDPVAPVRFSPDLACAARSYSEERAESGFFSHTDLQGRRAVARVRRAGFSAKSVGENLAWGQRTPEDAVRIWMDSPGHCRNLMGPHYRFTGVGVRAGAGGKLFWSQLFGG